MNIGGINKKYASNRKKQFILFGAEMTEKIRFVSLINCFKLFQSVYQFLYILCYTKEKVQIIVLIKGMVI